MEKTGVNKETKYENMGDYEKQVDESLRSLEKVEVGNTQIGTSGSGYTVMNKTQERDEKGESKKAETKVQVGKAMGYINEGIWGDDELIDSVMDPGGKPTAQPKLCKPPTRARPNKTMEI